jgi:hypothetical protein
LRCPSAHKILRRGIFDVSSSCNCSRWFMFGGIWHAAIQGTILLRGLQYTKILTIASCARVNLHPRRGRRNTNNERDQAGLLCTVASARSCSVKIRMNSVVMIHAIAASSKPQKTVGFASLSRLPTPQGPAADVCKKKLQEQRHHLQGCPLQMTTMDNYGSMTTRGQSWRKKNYQRHQ